MLDFIKKYWGYLLLIIGDLILFFLLLSRCLYWYLQIVLLLVIFVYSARLYLAWKKDHTSK